VRNVAESEVEALTVSEGVRRWIPLLEAAGMALTGLTRKVLSRARLLPMIPIEAIAPLATAEVV
jgi:hypothetical protein